MIYNLTNIARMRDSLAPLRLLERTIHFSTQNTAAGDVLQIIPVITGDVLLAAWAEVTTACTTGATIDLGYGVDVDYYGNGMAVDAVGKCASMLSGSLTIRKYAVIENKSELTEEVEVDGARIGDTVSVTPDRFMSDLAITAEVSANDVVAVHLVNNTGGALLLTDHTAGIIVNKAPNLAAPIVFTSSDTIDVVTNESITAGVLKVSALIARK